MELCGGKIVMKNKNFFDTNKIILIPWNYSNIHWVLVFVDIERLQFSVLDSLNNRNPEINIEQQMMNVLQFLCELCNYEHKEVTDWKRINWKDFTWINENGWLPKQTNTYDCGIFMLMNIYVIFKEKNAYILRMMHLHFENIYFP